MGSECDNEHCDVLLSDSNDDASMDLDAMDGDKPNTTTNKKQKKVSKKVVSLQSFLSMSDEGVLKATSFDHCYGEREEAFISWTILKEGKEITEGVMQHPAADSPFVIDISWMASTSLNDYFRIFFDHFFPSLEGKWLLLTNTCQMKDAQVIHM